MAHGSLGTVDFSAPTYYNADWGLFNAISNGGNQPGLWRVLTGTATGEWNYLLYGRTTDATVGEVSSARYARISVGGTKGLLLFPDNGFIWPSAAGDQPDNTKVNWSGSWNSGYQAYTLEQFAALDAAGCVFLPAAGCRGNNTDATTYVPGGFTYWTSKNADRNDYAYYMYINSYYGYPTFKDSFRHIGRPVRLVRDAN